MSYSTSNSYLDEENDAADDDELNELLSTLANSRATPRRAMKRKDSAVPTSARGAAADLVRWLEEKGRGLDLRDEHGTTAVMVAAETDCTRAALDALIAAGADVDERNANGETALYIACEANAVRCANALLDAEADVEMDDDQGVTPLMAACETNAEACVALLLEVRAEHRARDANGATALRYAAVANAVASLVALLDRGAVVDARDFDGRTALMAASRAGAVECVAVLLAAGADAAREDDDDVDARSYACTSVEKWERSAAECVERQFRVKLALHKAERTLSRATLARRKARAAAAKHHAADDATQKHDHARVLGGRWGRKAATLRANREERADPAASKARKKDATAQHRRSVLVRLTTDPAAHAAMELADIAAKEADAAVVQAAALASALAGKMAKLTARRTERLRRQARAQCCVDQLDAAMQHDRAARVLDDVLGERPNRVLKAGTKGRKGGLRAMHSVKK